MEGRQEDRVFDKSQLVSMVFYLLPAHFHPHPYHAALTLPPREQGEGGRAQGERRMNASCLVCALTLCRWSQMGSLLHAILGLPAQQLCLVLFATGTGKWYIVDRKKVSLESDNRTSTKRDV